MKISEIFLIVFILALFTGVYFFVQKKFINPPAKRFEAFKPEEADMEMIQRMQQEYYEKHKEEIEAKDEREIKKIQKEMKTAEPYLKQAEDYYQKEYGHLSKLPPKQQEKEMMRLIEKQQKEAEKYRKSIPGN